MGAVPKILDFVKVGGTLTQTASTLSNSRILGQDRIVNSIRSDCVITEYDGGMECVHFRDLKKSDFLAFPKWEDDKTCTFTINYPSVTVSYKYVNP